MPIDERWNQLDASDWDAFAQSWIDELRGTPSDSEANVGQSVVMMNFTPDPSTMAVHPRSNRPCSDDEFEDHPDRLVS